MKKRTLVVFILIILIGLASGFSYWLGQKQVEVKPAIPISSLTESRVIQSWSANLSGEVVEIDGRNLTLAVNSDTLSVFITEDAEIILSGTAKNLSSELVPARPEITKVRFEDIKIGNKVSITAESKGEVFEGKSVIIF